MTRGNRDCCYVLMNMKHKEKPVIRRIVAERVPEGADIILAYEISQVEKVIVRSTKSGRMETLLEHFIWSMEIGDANHKRWFYTSKYPYKYNPNSEEAVALQKLVGNRSGDWKLPNIREVYVASNRSNGDIHIWLNRKPVEKTYGWHRELNYVNWGILEKEETREEAIIADVMES